MMITAKKRLQKAKIISILLDENPNISLGTIEYSCLKNKYDIDKVREDLKSIEYHKKIQNFLSYLRDRYDTTQSALKHQVYKMGAHIENLSDEELIKLEIKCKEIYNEKIYTKKIHEICYELNLNFNNVSYIVNKNYIKRKESIRLKVKL